VGLSKFTAFAIKAFEKSAESTLRIDQLFGAKPIPHRRNETGASAA
jgi:hypothetical protein